MNQIKALTLPTLLFTLGIIGVVAFNIPWYISFMPFILGFSITAGLTILLFWAISKTEETPAPARPEVSKIDNTTANML